jgi:hypothetical protein
VEHPARMAGGREEGALPCPSVCSVGQGRQGAGRSLATPCGTQGFTPALAPHDCTMPCLVWWRQLPGGCSYSGSWVDRCLLLLLLLLLLLPLLAPLHHHLLPSPLLQKHVHHFEVLSAAAEVHRAACCRGGAPPCVLRMCVLCVLLWWCGVCVVCECLGLLLLLPLLLLLRLPLQWLGGRGMAAAWLAALFGQEG